MNSSTNNILVPLDFSDKSLLGLEQACNLAVFPNVELTLLHVIKGVDPIWSIFTDEEINSYIWRIKARMTEFANEFLGGRNIKVIPRVEKGRLCDTILRVSEELNVKFIVMGTSTADNIKKKIIGSNALRVVSEAKCPVITIKCRHPRIEIKNIILPLDLSKETKEKVNSAIEMAKIYHSVIHIVSVYTFNDEGIIHRLESQLNQVKQFISKHDVECTGEIVKCSDRANGLVEFIQKNQGDMVIITTHQQLEIVKYFLGSFAAQIIHGVCIPVMSIVPKIETRAVFNLPGIQ